MKPLLLIFSFFFASLVFSQEKTGEDIKVGLVLSGGGAKGLAHIGAIKAIEEAGIRIDYIGGTSMGAIVGALYAAGYSAKEMDSIFNSVNFSTLIQDEIPRSAKTFYEKDVSEKYALVLPFDKFKIGFPSGLSKGQNVYNLLSRLTGHVSHIEDFSKLPTPFFCIATDVETGRAVILDKGYLPRAVSASGALPTLFSPVVINDRVLVDGGVTNNYPVDEIRAKGMDIIIGVDVQDSLKNRESLQSGLDVLVQINNFRTIRDMGKKSEKTDIYINPDIEEFSVISFDSGRKIIDAGEEAANIFKTELENLALRQKTVNREKIDFLVKDSLYVKNVEIEGNENYTRAYVLGKLKLRAPTHTTYTNLSEGINNLSATGNFQDINYRVIENEAEGSTLRINLRENDSKMFLRLGAHFDDLYKTAAIINLTRKRLFTNNDIASLDFIVGDNVRYNFNYYIDKGFYWSVGINSSYTFFDKNVAVDFLLPETVSEQEIPLNQLELKYSDFTNQIFVETLFQRIFMLGLGAEHKYLRYLSESIGIDENNNPRTVFESTNYYSAYGFLKYDTFDNSFFPNKGAYFEGNFHLYLFAEGLNPDFEQFSIAQAKIGYAKSFLEKFSAMIDAEGGFKIGADNTKSLDFFLGGYGFKQVNNILPFYGYEALSLRGDTYLKTSLTVDYEIFDKNHINASVNIANVGDDLFSNGGWIDGIDYSGFALGYGLETFLGPLEAKYSYSPERDASVWFVSLGFRF